MWSQGLTARFARSQKGVAAIEFAMIIPMMFFLFVGCIEFSQAITVDRRITQVASSTADLIAREKTMTTAKVEGIMQIIDYLMEPYDPAELKVTVLNVVADIADATRTKVCWSYNHNGGTHNYTAGQSYSLPLGIVEAGNSVIVAEVTYNYIPLIFHYFITSAFPLEEKFYLKPRLSSYVEYNGTKCL
jgi:Flp pilus assembly protein TadG